MMHIIIRKSSEDSYWYRSMVGETFSVIGADDMNYYVDAPPGWGQNRQYGVAIEDAEVLEEGQLTLF